MTEGQPRKPSLKKSIGAERRSFSADLGLVAVEAPADGRTLPVIIRPTVDGVDLTMWAEGNRAFVDSHLATHGALLLRGFDGADLSGLAKFVKAVSGDLLEYHERSSPRTHVSDNIYTSTEHPAHQSIFFHNENSYAHTWPLKLFFLCSVAPEAGGETPIADCRQIHRALDATVRDTFARKRVMYVRNFSDELGLSWQTVFGTTDRDAVGAMCRDAGYEIEWAGKNALRTRRVGQAVARHPRSGELSWFNHATFFHVSTLEPDVRDALLEQYGEDSLPNNTYYGDGSPIEPSVLDHLRETYASAKVMLPWQQGDVMLVDNLLVAHAREPFEGPRRIHVAMSEPCTERDV